MTLNISKPLQLTLLKQDLDAQLSPMTPEEILAWAREDYTRPPPLV
jgi:hypothetical protein